jgi:sec-independent protein translocase protein TatB
MFDLGFSELFLIGVIALIVLGPERLPKAARTVGALMRRARSSYMSLKNDIERELAADELKQSIKSVTEPAESIRETVREVGSAGRDFEAELRAVDRANADRANAEAEIDSALGTTAASSEPGSPDTAPANADADERGGSATAATPVEAVASETAPARDQQPDPGDRP